MKALRCLRAATRGRRRVAGCKLQYKGFEYETTELTNYNEQNKSSRVAERTESCTHGRAGALRTGGGFKCGNMNEGLEHHH